MPVVWFIFGMDTLPTTPPNKTFERIFILCVAILFSFCLQPDLARAADFQDLPAAKQSEESLPNGWHPKIDVEWGGHLKATGSASWPDDRSGYQYVGTRTYYDGGLDFRLKNKLYFSNWGNFETHYEAILYGGDTRRKTIELQNRYPGLPSYGAVNRPAIDDEQRFFNLTKIIEENDNGIFYHRLDRFVLTWQPEWGTTKVGRQAVTWGHGFLFNPMDLFDPFAPNDVIRDYKVGVDMANLLFLLPDSADAQFIYVPRRDTQTGNVAWDASSLSGKLHFSIDTTELDVMAAYHYADHIVGIGSTGYWGNAAWRLDGTWTILDSTGAKDNYLSLVANMDYSWVWRDKNAHGFIEYFYCGLGETDYANALTDPALYERIMRGELFTLGRHYLSGEIQLELHPLFNTFLTIITNVEDPSGLIQPRALWDIESNLQCTLGANIYFGGADTEFGGFSIPGVPFLYVPSDSVYVWVTYYF